ncbi:hypothetical protein PATSB16_21680 [Pandoraea thiooxydans]|nr:hypothetical protein PATSB16_21680 [Pandoraea thiooxydans]
MDMMLFWFGLAGLAVVAELMTGTFYLLMIAIGFMAGGLAAIVGLSHPLQVVLSAVIAATAVLLLRRSRFGRRRKLEAARDPGVNLDIGQRLRVEAWQADGHARVSYRGADWDVDLAPGQVAASGWFEIREVRGSRLIVAAVDPHKA